MTPNRDFEFLSSLILKFLKNELTGKEQQLFDAWLAEDPANRELLDSFRHAEEIQKEINHLNQVDTDAELEKFYSKINHQRSSSKSAFTKWMPYVAAAVVLVLFSVGTYLYMGNKEMFGEQPSLAYDVMPGSKRAILQFPDGSVINLNQNSSTHIDQEHDGSGIEVKDGTLYFTAQHRSSGKNSYHALRTPRAGEYRVVLPDGTHVWLNASSYLRFPEDFGTTERRVELKGEAYFEVAHQPTKPFIVSFNQTEVKVLGTHFNINTYEKSSKTTLIEGSVRISEGGQQKMLKPGEEAFTGNGEIAVQPVEVYKSIAWKEGVFYFKEDSLKEVLDQIARWYDVEVVYEGTPHVQAISGNIRRQATLNQVLEMLTALTNAKFNLKDRIVTVNFNP